MVVKEIIFMDSQEDLAEAEVLVTDGKYDLFCFCHPCVYKVNDKIIEPLSCLDSDNIVISEEKECYVRRGGETFEHHICGCLSDKEKGIVSIGEILISIHANLTPKDIAQGSYIEFDVTRIDLC